MFCEKVHLFRVVLLDYSPFELKEVGKLGVGAAVRSAHLRATRRVLRSFFAMSLSRSLRCAHTSVALAASRSHTVNTNKPCPNVAPRQALAHLAPLSASLSGGAWRRRQRHVHSGMSQTTSAIRAFASTASTTASTSAIVSKGDTRGGTSHTTTTTTGFAESASPSTRSPFVSGAHFLGPLSENGAFARAELQGVLERWFDWRRTYHGDDPSPLPLGERLSPKFLAERENLSHHLGELCDLLKSEIPK
jgi:hypothetical protein